MISLYMASEGLLDKSALYLSDYFERNKTSYVDHFMAVREGNHIRNWSIFFLHGVEETAWASAGVFRAILDLKGRNVLPKFSSRRRSNAQAVMRLLYAKPVADVKTVVELTQSTANTVSALISGLVEHGVLVEVTGQQRNRLVIFKNTLHFISGTEMGQTQH